MTAAEHTLEDLRKPFPPAVIGKLPRQGTTLDYVGHAAVTDRLLTVDPGWSWEPLAFDEQGLPLYDRAGGLWIRLTILGVTRYGYGDGPDPKQRIGDAIRNAAMRFGVALDLWTKGELESQDPNGGGGDTVQDFQRKAERNQRAEQNRPAPDPVVTGEQDPWAGVPVRVPPDPEAVAKVTEQVAGCFDLKALRAIRKGVTDKAATGEIAEDDARELLTLIDECGQELRQKYEAEQAAAATSKATA